MKEEFIKKVKSRGYWRTNFRPISPIEPLPLARCREIVENNSVSLRGWSYPHFPRREGEDTGLEIHDNFYQGWVDWEAFKEFWRMYQSGQFLHYMGLREDWYEEDTMFGGHKEKIEPMTKLNIIGSVVYEITEMFQFLSRLAKEDIYKDGVEVNIQLCNTKDRELWISDFNRGPFFSPHKTSSETIEFSKIYSKEEAVSKPEENAVVAIRHVFDRFGWHDPSPEVIDKDQEDLLKHRF